MAASSAGSTVVFCSALLVIAILVLLLLRHYLPLRSTPAYLLLPVFLSIALPASIILLVPVDLATNSVVDEDGVSRGVSLPEGALLVLWRISYWLTFVLTWLVLPLLGEYADSGDRDPYRKIMYSLRSNAKFQLTVLLSSGAGLVYFFISSGINFMSLKSLIMSLAYAWGLILAIYLMGHGLVSLPRRLYRNANVGRQLRQLQSQAFRTNERLTQALDELHELEAQVWKLHQRKTGTARDFQDWIEDLFTSSDLPEARMSVSSSARLPDASIPAVITERFLADLTRKLKRARHKKIRFVEEWSIVRNEAGACQDILDAASSRSLDFKRCPPSDSFLTKYVPLTSRTRYYLHARVIPVCRLALSFLLATASVCVIWSEVFKAFATKLSIIGLSLIHHPNSSSNGKIGLGGQFMAAGWLLYMCVAMLTSVTEVKVWGNRALVTRHTYAESACWYGSLVARLTIPLAFNFITLIPTEIQEKTVFYYLLGRSIDLTALGTGFSEYFPIFILIPVLATSFNLYRKVKNLAGFGAFEDETDDDPNGFGAGGWREGKLLLEREWTNNGTSLNSLGLTSRDHSPSPRGTQSPIRASDRYTDSFPSASPLSTAASTTFGTTYSSSHLAPNDRQRFSVPAKSSGAPPPPRRTTTQNNSPYSDEPGSGGFFGEFAHRVKNTFDTAETPEWIARIPKPKWMAGNNDDSTGGSARTNNASGSQSGGIGRFFSEGGLRL